MANLPVLIIVNGIPGTGKTTLSKRLAKDLALPCLNKDDVKELLFDKLGVGDLQWSMDLGAGVAEMLFAFIDRWVERGRSLVAESAYFYQFAEPYFRTLLKHNDVVFLEVYCKTDHDVRRQRVLDRSQNGDRHPGHVDNTYADESNETVEAKYAPLKIGKLIEVDTTSFGEPEYQAFLTNVRRLIDTQQKEGSA